MTIKIEDFNFDNILLFEKSFEKILISNVSYNTFIGAKPMCIRFDKVDGFITVYDGTRYFSLFVPEKYDAISNKIRYLISKKKWYYICTVHLTVCAYHVTYAFQSESTLYSCLNVKELLARSRREI